MADNVGDVIRVHLPECDCGNPECALDIRLVSYDPVEELWVGKELTTGYYCVFIADENNLAISQHAGSFAVISHLKENG